MSASHVDISRSTLFRNCFNAESATAIVNAVQDKPQILTLCGIKPEDTECDFNTQGLGAGDAVLLAFDLRNNSALVKLEYAAARLFLLSAVLLSACVRADSARFCFVLAQSRRKQNLL